ncbi:YbfB/YjiJ family MFS transporter [Tomitella biformata]|uniref:YbfB/YjiJ family MFS transporter n=1 Tax=Tomitella biformata TaxID=630403 RepID=UPI0004657C4C|nr:YbfB/YjiJ family MFS transporter [Tomitella biformata]
MVANARLGGAGDRGRGWTALQAWAGLAAAMGLGRFIYTPLLPLMEQQTGSSPSATAVVATMNYLGYFLGAVALSIWPAWATRRGLYRGAIVTLVVSELAMILAPDIGLWSGARLLAGLASAVVFVYCATAILGRASPGLAYAGIGTGIACSGLLVVALESRLDWAQLWVAAAALTALFGALAWGLTPSPWTGGPATGAPPHGSRTKGALLVLSYSLEGLGYIILGTFLVAAVSADGPRWSGPAAWVVVGLAAAISPTLWSMAQRRFETLNLLAAALVLQAIASALPALVPGTPAAMVSAVLFGGTFVGIVMLSMAAGARLGIPRSAAVLTAGYGLGQIIGPVAVAPMLGGGYNSAFIAAAVVLAAAALLTLAIRDRGTE